MESSFNIDLFEVILSKNLSNEAICEQEVFAYLNSLHAYPKFDQLKTYSEKLNQIKSYFHDLQFLLTMYKLY
jgi:hypothetical protein